MLAEQRTDSLLARQDNAYSNLMLTQVAEHLDSQRQKENSEEDGRLSLLHEVVLNARLILLLLTDVAFKYLSKLLY